jgi:hypothetical protein
MMATAMYGVSQQNAPVLLVAAGLPQLPLMLKNAKPYTECLFDFRTIEGLPRATAATALTLPAQRARVKFDHDALELILDRTDGYPHFLQQWGETIWREAEGPTITLRDAQAAEELVNDELDRRFFRDRSEKATEAERIYMAAMADLGDSGNSSGEIASHMGMTQKGLSVRRAGLIEKGLIHNPIGTQLDFTVPQFAPTDPPAHRSSKPPTRFQRRRRSRLFGSVPVGNAIVRACVLFRALRGSRRRGRDAPRNASASASESLSGRVNSAAFSCSWAGGSQLARRPHVMADGPRRQKHSISSKPASRSACNSASSGK